MISNFQIKSNIGFDMSTSSLVLTFGSMLIQSKEFLEYLSLEHVRRTECNILWQNPAKEVCKNVLFSLQLILAWN